MGELEPESLVDGHPSNFRVLGVSTSRFGSMPSRDNEDMILSLAVCSGPELLKHSQLSKLRGRDSDLLMEFPA